MQILICLCKCQGEHVITAGATILETPDQTKEAALAAFKESCEVMFQSKIANTWCALCGSRYYSYSIRETDYKDLSEAWAEMQKLEKESRAANGSAYLRRN